MNVSRPLLFVVGFTAARGGLFFAPIILANILSLETYGAIERAQTVAVFIALVVGLGLPSSVPLILLRDEVTARRDTLLWSIMILSSLAFFTAAVAILMLGKALNPWVLIPLTVGVLLMQNMWSAFLKARGHANAALFLETGFWVSAVIGASLSLHLMVPNDWIALAFGAYGVLLWAVTLQTFRRQRAPFDFADLRANVLLGAPLMFATLLTLTVTSGGRFILGVTSNPETFGIFAVLFRATALPLVGHQLLTVAFFRQLYTWDEETLRRRSPLIPIGVFGFVIGFWGLSDPLGWMLGSRFEEVFSQFRFVGFIILSQTILWSAIALNDFLNARLQISAYVARFSLPFLLVGMIALTGAVVVFRSDDPLPTLLLVTIGQSVLMVTFYLAQCAATLQKGHSFWRLWLSVGGSYCAVVSVIMIQMAQS